MAELCTSAFGLIAALAWNAAAQEMLDKTDLATANKVYYAIVVTVFAVVVAWLLGHLGKVVHGLEDKAKAAFIANANPPSTVDPIGARLRPSREIHEDTSMTMPNFRKIGAYADWCEHGMAE